MLGKETLGIAKVTHMAVTANSEKLDIEAKAAKRMIFI